MTSSPRPRRPRIAAAFPHRAPQSGNFAHAGSTLPRRPLLMGILNVTPDSFSDGGNFIDASAAIEHGLALAADGRRHPRHRRREHAALLRAGRPPQKNSTASCR